MKKSTAHQIAEMIRANAPESHQGILWAVSYHLPLFFWGIQPAEKTLEEIAMACNQGRADNLLQRIGLDNLMELSGPLVDTDYNGRLRVQEEITPKELTTNENQP
jgi:hypothetical protein